VYTKNSLTLPDYLRPGLKLVFIGLNPGLYSAQTGKYFARQTNRFWPALSASNFFGREVKAGDEKFLFDLGVGFIDVVERATSQIDELSPEEIQIGVKILRRKIIKFAPQTICFIGLTGFRWVFGVPAKVKVAPGPQQEMMGSSRIYVLPSTSPANAHYLLAQMVKEFSRFKKWLLALGIDLSALC